MNTTHCKASKKLGHVTVPCNAPAIAIVRGVYDEAPYDIAVCDEHGGTYDERGFTIALLEELNAT